MDAVRIRGAADDELELTARETGLEAKAVWSCLNMMNSRFCKDFKTVLGCIVTWGEICSAASNPTVVKDEDEEVDVDLGWCRIYIMCLVNNSFIYMYGCNF